MSFKNSVLNHLFQLGLCGLLLDCCLAFSCISYGLREHPTDCGKFFSCTPSGPVLMNCPAGLHFNPQILVCDWPDKAGCRSPNRDEDHESQKCPIYRHPTDCAKFYICSPLGHLLMHCPFGLKFNSKISVCDWPTNVECPHPSGTSSTVHVAETTITSSPPNEAHTETTEVSSEEPVSTTTNDWREESTTQTPISELGTETTSSQHEASTTSMQQSTVDTEDVSTTTAEDSATFASESEATETAAASGLQKEDDAEGDGSGAVVSTTTLNWNR